MTTFTVETIDRQPAAVVHAEVPIDEIRTVFDRGFRQVMRVAEAQGVAITGPPFGFYPRMPTDTVEVAVGFPVSTAITPDGDVRPFELPGGRVITGIHTGPYETLAASYRELTEWAAAEGHPLAAHMWESYLTDPRAQPDPATWQTKMTWPLA
ncbi:MAG TPA: GyrI-like domain-containing protein [Solirubrobacteraceae bacterium]|nr:GyrI-like domain-containing protein [Solirubrobacteraceae bacterium]